MAISKETEQWLTELKASGGLTDDAYNALKSSLESNSKGDEFVKGSVLRQADYSRQSAEIQAARKAVEDSQNDLKSREASVTKFQTDLANWKTGAEAKFVQALQEQELASRQAAAAMARLKAIAAANGLDEKELIAGLDVNPNPNPVNPNPINPGVDIEKFKREMVDTLKTTANGIVMVDATIADLAQEYTALFQKPFPGSWATVVQEAMNAGKPLREFVESTYKFSDRKNELAEADVARRIKEGVDAELAKRLSEGALGASQIGRTDIHGSPIFSTKLKAPDDNNGGGGVSAAVAAFQAGKHRQGR